MAVDPQWGLLNGGGYQNALAMGHQLGQQMRVRAEEKEYRNALSGYDPNDPTTIDPVMAVRPEVGIQLRERAAARTQQQQEQRRADLPFMEKLITSAVDEPSYQRARGIAEQYGIDTSQLPPTFDPAWRDQQLQTVRLLNTPKGQEALSTLGKVAADMGFPPGTPGHAAKVQELWQVESTKFLATQPGGGVASVAPGQAAQFVIQPNDGSQPAGAPVAARQAKTLGGVTYYQDENGEWYEGDAGGNASGGF